MIRRSGRFNYEIVRMLNLTSERTRPSGPVGGWHTHVKTSKKMSFEEYKASIGQTTDMTNNILAGSKSGMGKSRRDPRASKEVLEMTEHIPDGVTEIIGDSLVDFKEIQFTPDEFNLPFEMRREDVRDIHLRRRGS